RALRDARSDPALRRRVHPRRSRVHQVGRGQAGPSRGPARGRRPLRAHLARRRLTAVLTLTDAGPAQTPCSDGGAQSAVLSRPQSPDFDAVAVALLGEEAAALSGEVLIDGVGGDHGVEGRRALILLRTQDPPEPLGLLLA